MHTGVKGYFSVFIWIEFGRFISFGKNKSYGRTFILQSVGLRTAHELEDDDEDDTFQGPFRWGVGIFLAASSARSFHSQREILDRSALQCKYTKVWTSIKYTIYFMC
jgi:hypothetical protein